MSSIRTIRIYARILFKSAVEAKDLQGVKDRFAKIDLLHKKIPEFRLLLISKRISQSQKLAVLSEILKDNGSQFDIEFIKILTENGEIGNLSEILNSFFLLVERESDILNVTITSAIKLDESTQLKIVENIRSNMKKKVAANMRINPDLIGGITLRIGNTVIDGSVARRLEKLKTALAGA